MKTLKTIKCWGIVYGLISKKATESITIECECASISDFKKACFDAGHKLIGKPYISQPKRIEK